MITRPLELQTRLRREPRNFDWLFYVNVGLVALFFSLFGSRFVLAPGVVILPSVVGATEGARTVTHHISVQGDRQIFAGDGLRDLAGLQQWLAAQVKTVRDPVLLVQANQDVDLSLLAQVWSSATEAGFTIQQAAVDPKSRAPARLP